MRQRIGAHLRLSGFFVQAIESETNPGIPDMYYRRPDLAGWLELKRIKEMPKRSTTAIFRSLNHPLLPEQVNWIGLELTHGGMADMLVAYERDYFLVPGESADIFNELTEPELRKFQLKKEEIVAKLKLIKTLR